MKVEKSYFYLGIFLIITSFWMKRIEKLSFQELLSEKKVMQAAEVSPTSIPITVTVTVKPTLTKRPPTITLKPTLKLTSVPTTIPFSLNDLENLFTKYSQTQSVARELLRKIAYCESRFNPGAVNGVYGGLYQFSSSSWQATRRAMNLDPNSQLRFNAEEAIKTAAFKIASQGTAAWPNCGK